MYTHVAKRLYHASKKTSVKIQYVSDLHVDVNKKVPVISQVSNILATCGDIGNPDHPNFELFLRCVSKQFEKTFMIAGNHEYDCGPIYDKTKVAHYKPKIVDICKSINNITFLDNSCSKITDRTIIAGTTLWSNPILKPGAKYDKEKYDAHVDKHKSDVEWLRQLCLENNNKQILVMSHFVPTFDLIEEKYKARGIHRTSFFASDLEYLIDKPIVGWLCGHTHSIKETFVNGILCGVNACGYQGENQSNDTCVKFIDV